MTPSATDTAGGAGNRTVVCVSGTNRPDNYTARALAITANELAKRGTSVEWIDGRELGLNFPGHPETADARMLVDTVSRSAGVIIASPEYHGSLCAHTKLIIENLGFPSVLAGKPVGLLGVAAGRIGAIKSLEQLKGTCSHVGALVVPGAISIAGVRSVFDENGECLDSASEAALRGLAAAMLEFLDHYICPRFRLEERVRERGEPWVTEV